MPLTRRLPLTGHTTWRDLLPLVGRADRSGRGLIRLGRRQGEHRTRPRRLLRGRPLGGGSQRPPPTPGRLRNLTLLRCGLAGRRGQGGRQRVLLAGFTPGPSPGRRGHALRRNGPAQPRTRGGGPRRVFGGRDDGPFGDTLDGTPDGQGRGRPTGAPPSSGVPSW
ncbi:hypothetical protein [Streptomyces chartreusis]|uniref:hypothetical protein n=1 Tax=Streptomyces chartreusis TaxID=1969 RepID=UPI0033A8C40C